jgi:hypothetical protein
VDPRPAELVDAAARLAAVERDDDRLGDVGHPHRSHARIGRGQQHERARPPEPREAVEEAVALAEDHRRAQDGRFEPARAQRLFAGGLAAQIRRRRSRPDAERAHVDDAADAGAAARGSEAARQFDVHAVELGSAAVQDPDEVDHRVDPGQQPREHTVVADVGFDDFDRRQRSDRIAAHRVAGRDDDPRVAGAAAVDQMFADRATDEAAAAEHEDVARVHRVSRVQGNSLSLRPGSRGPIGPPRRVFSDGAAPPSSAA